MKDKITVGLFNIQKNNVIPAKTGIQSNPVWMPACAGMTKSNNATKTNMLNLILHQNLCSNNARVVAKLSAYNLDHPGLR